MKRLVVVFAVVAVLAIPGCINPPLHTLYIDQDGDGRVDGLVWDRNADNIPDRDPNGQLALVPGSEGYKSAETLDELVPGALTGVGGLLGATGIGAVLVGLGAAWKFGRFGRIFMNTVMCIQQARLTLKGNGQTAALAVVDDALSRQAPATIQKVAEIKVKCAAISTDVISAPGTQMQP